MLDTQMICQYFYTPSDEDYLALINERVRVFLVTSKANEMYEEYNINPKDYNIPDGVFEYNLELFKEIKGLNEPKEFTEVKAIKGDASDNIPGIKGVGDKAAFPLVKEYGSLENIYDTIENLNKNEEKELRTFLKEYLGISRSPIANMLKNGTIELDNGDKLEYRCISGQLTDEQLEFQELIKDKIDTRFPIELLNSEDKELLVNNKIANIELSAKESAFMSRDLATIATDISDIHNLSLDDVKLDLDKTLLKKRLLELDIKSLL
ncbi:5'-3' exonuclease H3TH domain-containing protein (plasmid) [Clostridium perfringens]|uniref:5'-3' exonuclease H3TH domain-containing protein n=1 Tax=Clostridium perfringens TaxID=1502 RepID=UPI001CC95CB7|nr:5'-3' exonuclease H3TH domain-containing protein [Clostridium perfringens]